METVIIFFVLIITLSIVDLTVGVANDAVNFLNSAVGSKVASFRIILFISMLGILVGVMLSSGMMEIARKGIFNPSAFSLYDVMVIFVAYVLTDILLLDFFNTYGIPTSTTVSMISSLTGSSLALTLIYLTSANNTNMDLNHFMNLSKLTLIYTAILLSIVISFIFGYIIQFLTRVIFSFDYRKYFKFWGPLWSSLAITMILFFVSIKGLEGAVFGTEALTNYINQNRFLLVGISIVFWALLFYILELFFEIDKILKFIVLVGTFSLAMSFASNDLVNFIGPALAAWNAFNIAINSPEPLTLLMDGLKASVKAPVFVLLFSGLVMSATLFFSKKVRTVTSTEVSLGRQTEGYEGFGSLALARSLVRVVMSIGSFFSKITPEFIRRWVNSRFNTTEVILIQDEKGEKASFDLIRATINLATASALISLATSLKLPLSTTYVTFIVAMSTAFADRAWGSDYAVQRITGILIVIGGWFLTAIICITLSGIMATIIYFTGIIGALLLLSLIIFSFIKTAFIHKKREKEKKSAEEKLIQQQNSLENSLTIFFQELYNFVQRVYEISNFCIQGIIKYRLKDLKKAKKQAKELSINSEEIYKDFVRTIKNIDDEIIDSIHPYSSALNEITIITNQVNSICERCYNYVDNSQKQLTMKQVSDLKQINKIFNDIFQKILSKFQILQSSGDGEIIVHQKEFEKETQRIYKTYLKALKRPTANINSSMLYLFLIENIYSISTKTINLVGAINNMHENIQNKLKFFVSISQKNDLMN
ncbi:MAG: inorganic phosphate transporter [Candidatus Kapaibacteriales bacterium]